LAPAGGVIAFSSGRVFVARPLWGEPIEELTFSGVTPHAVQFNWWFEGGKYVSGGDCYSIPLWCLVLVSLAATMAAWWLDTARRRSRVGLCSSCGYDRTGLAPMSLCPECGTAPSAGAPPHYLSPP